MRSPGSLSGAAVGLGVAPISLPPTPGRLAHRQGRMQALLFENG
jgi:hypothetical protein